MNQQKRIRQEKGITLIALIITIVVLLILAVVAIRAVQGDGILGYARNAANDYENAAQTEANILQNYIDEITENAPNGGTTGEGTGSSSSKITWTKTSEGELVVGSTVVTSTGENFYVIGFKGDNNETVILLAKDNIDTTNLVQSVSAGPVAFCEDSVAGYWGTGTAPYDIKEETQPIPSTHTAAYAADRYGATLGVTGRLMLYSEAVALESANGEILYGRNGKSSSTYLDYWLGSATWTNSVWFVHGYGTYYGEIPCEWKERGAPSC